MNTIANYIHTKKINLDLEQVKSSVDIMRTLIADKFYTGELNPNNQLDHSVYSKYNLLLYPLPQFHELYNEIKTFFHECNTDTVHKNFYVQCWLNIYNKNDYIEWHHHSPEEHHAWHGFFCVDCEPSYTRYRIKGQPDDALVQSENNQLVLSPSGRDQHRTAPWPYDDRPRITIAFDIIPKEYIIHDQFLNHWIPI